MLRFLRAVIRNYGALPKHAASGWRQQDVDSYRLHAKSQLHAEVARGAVHDQNGPRCLSSQRTPTCWHKKYMSKLLQKHLRLMPAKARWCGSSASPLLVAISSMQEHGRRLFPKQERLGTDPVPIPSREAIVGLHPRKAFVPYAALFGLSARLIIPMLD